MNNLISRTYRPNCADPWTDELTWRKLVDMENKELVTIDRTNPEAKVVVITEKGLAMGLTF